MERLGRPRPIAGRRIDTSRLTDASLSSTRRSGSLNGEHSRAHTARETAERTTGTDARTARATFSERRLGPPSG